MRFPFKKIRFILADINARYDAINNGGCGVMATILATHLEDMVDEYRIVSAGPDGGSNIDEVRPYVSENTMLDWCEQGVDFNHVWVEFRWGKKWYAIDCTGIYTLKRMHRRWRKPSEGSFTIKEMKEISSNPSGWNWWFDRSQIPSMKVVTARAFNKLKLELDYTIEWSYL